MYELCYLEIELINVGTIEDGWWAEQDRAVRAYGVLA
jgi:hypothetical protein